MDATGLVGVIGGILVVMLGLLISMILGLKNDGEKRNDVICLKIKEIKDVLNTFVDIDDYKEDRKEVVLKLDEHGDRLLRLEIKVRVDKYD
jgi:hypothetical protein